MNSNIYNLKAAIWIWYCLIFFPAISSASRNQYYSVTPTNLQVGDTWLPRTDFSSDNNNEEYENKEDDEDDYEDGAGVRLQILRGQLLTLRCMMKCVERGWLTILTVPTASGKTSLVRLLTKLSNHKLHEYFYE
jgi:hypothetical protein